MKWLIGIVVIETLLLGFFGWWLIVPAIKGIIKEWIKESKFLSRIRKIIMNIPKTWQKKKI